MNKITGGDLVKVSFNNAQMTLCECAEVLHEPCAPGDSWIFRDTSTGAVHYVSEGCTISKYVDAPNMSYTYKSPDNTERKT